MLVCVCMRAWMNSTLIHAKQQIYIYAYTLFNLFRAISWFCGDIDNYGYVSLSHFLFFLLYLHSHLFHSPDDFLVFRFLLNSIVYMLLLNLHLKWCLHLQIPSLTFLLISLCSTNRPHSILFVEISIEMRKFKSHELFLVVFVAL